MDKEITCLFLGPPGDETERLFDHLRVLHLHLRAVRITTMESESQYGELVSSVSESVYRSLEKADLIIADITDGNPNVMYELGFAHALKKPVLPLVQKGASQIPSDLRGYLYFTYDTTDPERLVHVVVDWIRRYMKGREEV